MLKLEEKIQALQTPEQKEQEGDSAGSALKREITRIPSQINIGMAHMLGLPGVAANAMRGIMGYGEKSAFPTGQEIQQKMADYGMTYEPGEGPDTVYDRFLQNLGASAIPAAGMYAKGYQALAPYATEFTASGGGAVGGKMTQATEWGQRNPELARAIGELSGGLGLSSTAALRGLRGTPAMVAYRWLKAPFRGEWAKRRAARRIGEVTHDVDAAERSLREMGDVEGLTPVQKTGDRGLAQLRQRVEAELPEELETGLRQRSRATQQLRGQAQPGTENIVNVRQQLENRLTKLGDEAEQALRRTREAEHPIVYNKLARDKLDEAYSIARKEESKVWGKLPEGEPIRPQSLQQIYKEELENITEGGDIKEIDSFIRQKLGKMNKKGRLVGGELIGGKKETASPKAIHQFYSRLGRRVRELSEQAGQTNKIRILGRLREAALDDLDTSVTGEQYREAIRFSRELNDKFTSGGIGKILGFQRGQAAGEARTLDNLLGSGGQEAREAIDQALGAAPGAKDDIKNFIRTRFAMAAQNARNNKINTRAGEKFMERHNRVLDAFPDLKNEIKAAVKKQTDVDSFTGATDVSEMSPLVKERTAASLFLGADPGDELQKVIQHGISKGKTSNYFKQLVKEAGKDATGKAKKGLKNAFAGELFDYARKSGVEDEITGETFISGKRFLKRLSDLEEPAVKSGLLNKTETERFRKIGRAFRNIENELEGKAAPQLMTDAPGQLLHIVARVAGAQTGGKLGAASAGGSLQTAQIFSGFAKNLVQRLTKDEARALIIRATHDESIMKDLLKSTRKMNERQQMELIDKIKDTASNLVKRGKQRAREARAPMGAVAPPTVSAGRTMEEQDKKRQLEGKIQQLQNQ